MKTITLVYPDGISGMGFGDYLSGCLGITEWGSVNGIHVTYYFAKHPISLYYDYDQPDEPANVQNIYCSKDAEQYFLDFKNSSQDTTAVISNWNPYTQYSAFTLQRVKMILSPTSELLQAVNTFLKDIQEYRIVHIRLDDRQFTAPSHHAKTVQTLSKKHPFTGTTIILSNNIGIKKDLAKYENWTYYDSIPIHMGSPQYKTGDIFDTCVELELLKRATDILQFSVYNWSSNFSKRIAELYSIPFTYVPIRNEQIEFYKSLGQEFEYHNQ